MNSVWLDTRPVFKLYVKIDGKLSQVTDTIPYNDALPKARALRDLLKVKIYIYDSNGTYWSTY